MRQDFMVNGFTIGFVMLKNKILMVYYALSELMLIERNGLGIDDRRINHSFVFPFAGFVIEKRGNRSKTPCNWNGPPYSCDSEF